MLLFSPIAKIERVNLTWVVCATPWAWMAQWPFPLLPGSPSFYITPFDLQRTLSWGHLHHMSSSPGHIVSRDGLAVLWWMLPVIWGFQGEQPLGLLQWKQRVPLANSRIYQLGTWMSVISRDERSRSVWGWGVWVWVRSDSSLEGPILWRECGGSIHLDCWLEQWVVRTAHSSFSVQSLVLLLLFLR